MKASQGVLDFVETRDSGLKTEPRCAYGTCDNLVRRPAAHRPYCSEICRLRSWNDAVEVSAAERDRLKALAAERCRIEGAIARWAALQVLQRRRTCIISHVRGYLDARGIELAWSLNWAGSMFQHKWFEATGEREMAFHPEANARKVNVYRLTSAGHFACHVILDNLGRSRGAR